MKVTPTPNFAEMYEGGTPKQRDALKSAVLFYVKELQTGAQRAGPLVAVNSAHKFVDGEVSALTAEPDAPKPSCRKGCAHCCHLEVVCNRFEAALMVSAAKSAGLRLDRARLRKQAEAVKAGTFKSLPLEVRRCVMLKDDNTCAVYESRPANCRKYMVASEPELCDTVAHQGGKVAILNSPNIESFVTAMHSIYAAKPMASMLLQVL